MKQAGIIIIAVIAAQLAAAADTGTSRRNIVYKKTPQAALRLDLFYPRALKPGNH